MILSEEGKNLIHVLLTDNLLNPNLENEILQAFEKAEKLDKYENENWIAVERKVWDLERQENKQLKEQLESHKGTGIMIQHELTEAKQILEKIKELPIKFPCKHHAKFTCDCHVPMNELKKILKESKDAD